MTYRSLYGKVDKLLRQSSSSVRRVQTQAGGAIWEDGVYSVRLYPTGPAPFWVRLERRGGRKPIRDFFDEPTAAEQIARMILDHFRDRRNAF